MKTLSLLLMAIVITACSEAVAMEAPTSRIVITSGDSIAGHSQFVILGKVRAHCMENPKDSDITAADVIADGNLQRSAYRAYGSQVDAIVQANVFYVSHRTLVNPLFDAEGHLECEGTAIHFTGEPVGQSTSGPN
jgi:hypothetical protein